MHQNPELLPKQSSPPPAYPFQFYNVKQRRSGLGLGALGAAEAGL